MQLPDLDLNSIEEFKNFSIKELFQKEYTLKISSEDVDIDNDDGFININFINGIPEKNYFDNFIRINTGDEKECKTFNPLVHLNKIYPNRVYEIEFLQTPDKPVKLTNYFTDDGSFTPVDFRFIVKKDITVNLLETNVSSREFLTISNREFNIESGFVNYSRVDRVNRSSSLIYNYCGRVISGKLEAVLLNSQGYITMNNWQINLEKEESICNIFGVIDLDGDTKHGTICKISHNSNNTSSQQEFRHILNGSSYAMYDGDSIVKNRAKDSKTSQSSKSIMLSKSARILNKPRLNIFTGEVKATHGASVGKLNQDDIFYLKQRGLKDETVKKLLVDAFIGDILDRVSDSKIREYIYDKR